jgi:hypothetical protein
LGLADDHAVERAGYSEEMANGFALAELVEVRLDVTRGDGEVLVEEAKEVGFGLRLGAEGITGFGGVVLQGEELDAVAGGEDETLADARLVEEGAGGVGEAGGGDGEALAYLDGRGDVVDAEEDEAPLGRARGRGLGLVHGAVNLWTTENWFAAQTARTTRKMKLER